MQIRSEHGYWLDQRAGIAQVNFNLIDRLKTFAAQKTLSCSECCSLQHHCLHQEVRWPWLVCITQIPSAQKEKSSKMLAARSPYTYVSILALELTVWAAGWPAHARRATQVRWQSSDTTGMHLATASEAA